VFRSLGEWRDFVRDSRAKIARAVPIAEKYRVPLGLENHKDWTVDELAGLMQEYSSEWLGVCLDTGNNLALLDDPMEVVERLAPYTLNTHLKDMALAEYPEGLLLVEPVFGEGYLDLRRIVAAVRQARPGARFTVEQLTRNPLKVPVLTDRYWASFSDRNGRYLARTMAAARAHAWKGPLPEPEKLDRDARIRLEEDNVVKCLKFAAGELGMGRA
jgi:sugar phosphate isomerase/epimerase